MQVIQNVWGSLGDHWHLKVGVAPAMQKFIGPLLEKFEGIEIIQHNKAATMNSYNAMVMSRDFWESFDSETILFFDIKSVLFHNNIDKFVHAKEPILAAPLCDDNGILQNSLVQWRESMIGLSLRMKSWMLRCIESEDVHTMYQKLRVEYQGKEFDLPPDNEYVFFATCMHLFRSPFQAKVTEQLSLEFSIEKPCDGHFSQSNNGPMGGQEVWLHSTQEQMEKLLSH